jgi:hypothetical protein
LEDSPDYAALALSSVIEKLEEKAESFEEKVESKGVITEDEEEAVLEVSVEGDINLTDKVQTTLDAFVNSFEGIEGKYELELNVEKDDNETVVEAEIDEGELSEGQMILWEMLQNQVEELVVEAEGEDIEIEIEIDYFLEVEEEELEEEEVESNETEEIEEIVTIVNITEEEEIEANETEVNETEEVEEVTEVSWEYDGGGLWTKVYSSLETGVIVDSELCFEDMEVTLPVSEKKMNVWGTDCEWDENVAGTDKANDDIDVLCFKNACIPTADCKIYCPLD